MCLSHMRPGEAGSVGNCTLGVCSDDKSDGNDHIF